VRAELNRRGVDALLLVAESVPAGEMPWHYRAADCLLLTSDSEGGPNAVKESLACGTPVVGVPVGDLPELITAPAMGRVTSRDPRALADAVQSLGRAADLRPRLLPPELDADAIAARLIDLYQQAIRDDRSGVPHT